MSPGSSPTAAACPPQGDLSHILLLPSQDIKHFLFAHSQFIFFVASWFYLWNNSICIFFLVTQSVIKSVVKFQRGGKKDGILLKLQLP